MSETPITVTYSLEEVLGEIKQGIKELNQKIENNQKETNQKLDDLQKETNQKLDELQKETNQKLESIQKEINQRFDRVDERLNKLEVGQAKLEEKVEGLSKRLENQEFINRGILVGLFLALTAGIVKLLFPNFPNLSH